MKNKGTYLIVCIIVALITISAMIFGIHVYSKNKSITVDDKIIIAYLAIYCSI